MIDLINSEIRNAFAAMVKEGLYAPHEGKNDASATNTF